MPTIPSGIKPVVEAYSIGPPDGVLRTEVAGGMPRYSLEWDRGPQQFRVTFILDDARRSVWAAFFHFSIKNGSLAFDMPLDSGFGVATHSVTIVPGTYNVSRRGVQSVVTFNVEATSAAYDLSDAEAEALIAAHNGYASSDMAAIPRGFKPVVENYGLSGPDGVHRSDVAGGAARYAMAWDRGVQQFRVTLILTAAEFEVWTAFFHHKIKKGAYPFEMPLDSGFGSETHIVHLLPGTYGATRNGVITVVSFSVEAESTVYAMGADGAAALIELYEEYGDGGAELLARIAQFANVDTLVLQS